MLVNVSKNWQFLDNIDNIDNKIKNHEKIDEKFERLFLWH